MSTSQLAHDRIQALEAMGTALAALTRCRQAVAQEVQMLTDGAPGKLELEMFLANCVASRDALCTAIRLVPDQPMSEAAAGVAEDPGAVRTA